MKDNLVGKLVTVFLDGGWEISGEVKSLDENKFIIEDDGDLMMVFKSKISCLLISEKERVIAPSVRKASKDTGNLPRPAKVSTQSPGAFPMNPITYEESGMSIPSALLGGKPVDDEEDLSIFFQGGHSLTNSGDGADTRIQFELEDDSKDEDR